jgi:basic membrane protein A
MKRSSFFMTRKRGGFIAVLLAFALVVAACGDDDAETTTEATEAPTTTAAEVTTTEAMEPPTASGLVTLEEECATYGGLQAPEGFRVNLVTDIGKVDDGTFNQFAFEGLQGALECFGIEESDYIETASEADYAANIATTLAQEPDVVVTVGFLITTDTEEAALANPDVNFIGIDQWLPEYPANMIGVLFNEHEGGFIAGAMAASLTQSGVVGVVGGREDVPPVVKFVNGYEAGAKYINPDVRVLSIYNESFVDPAKGASDAAQFMGEGADVIFGAGGPTGSGGVKAAAEAGAWGIGVDQDEYFTTFAGGTAPGSEYLATSAMKRVDLAVFRNIAAAIEGSFAGGMYILTAANAGITYAPFHDAMIPAEAATTVEMVRAGLADGSIDTGVCGVDGLYVGQGSFCDAPAGPPADWPEKIVFGFVPSQDQEELQDDVDTFSAVLSGALGIEVEGLVTTDYTGLGVALGTGQADFGAFGPLGYVLAERAFPGEFVLVAQSVRFGSDTYHGQWFTNDPSICAEPPVPGAFENLDPATGELKADGVATLLGPTETVALQVGYNGDGTRDETVSEGYACNAGLDAVIGRTIAFTTETSTSGFVFPTLQLINAGITEDQYTPIFSGGHDASVLAVYNGDADIGVSFDDARRQVREENPDVGEKVIVFNLTPDIANDVIAARASLPQSLIDAFFAAINDFIATPEGEELMDTLYSWTAIAPANPASLVPIGQAIDELGYGG